MFQENFKALDAHDTSKWDNICHPDQIGIEGEKIIEKRVTSQSIPLMEDNSWKTWMNWDSSSWSGSWSRWFSRMWVASLLVSSLEVDEPSSTRLSSIDRFKHSRWTRSKFKLKLGHKTSKLLSTFIACVSTSQWWCC